MVSQSRQLILGRACTRTLKCDGTYSNTSRSSVPIRVRRVLPQAGHVHAASCSTRSRGRCSGKALRIGCVRSCWEGDGCDAGECGGTVCSAWPSSSSPSSNSICSISLSSFSEERPNLARRNTASCILSFSICSVLAYSSVCSEAAKDRSSSRVSGRGAVVSVMNPVDHRCVSTARVI